VVDVVADRDTHRIEDGKSSFYEIVMPGDMPRSYLTVLINHIM
jgi:hypothetical protein